MKVPFGPKQLPSVNLGEDIPTGSMGLVYLPT